MTDNTHMVDLPWRDGTTRTVPEGTLYESMGGIVHIARADECRSSIAWVGVRILTEAPEPPIKVDVRIFTEAPEPPVKVNVPTGTGAIVSFGSRPDVPGYVLTREGWLGLNSWTHYWPTHIADLLRAGARVLFEGVDE